MEVEEIATLGSRGDSLLVVVAGTLLPDDVTKDDTLIEVVDPVTGELLADRRFDPVYIRHLAGVDLWATVRRGELTP